MLAGAGIRTGARRFVHRGKSHRRVFIIVYFLRVVRQVKVDLEWYFWVLGHVSHELEPGFGGTLRRVAPAQNPKSFLVVAGHDDVLAGLEERVTKRAGHSIGHYRNTCKKEAKNKREIWACIHKTF